MSKSYFDFKEYSEYVQKLGIAKTEFRIWLKTFLLQQAQRVVRAGKRRTPVDTGFLRNSWYIGNQQIIQNIKNGKARIDETNSDVLSIKLIGNVLEVEIGLGAEYASFVEYGHHAYEGKYMLTISIEEVQNKIPARFNKEFKNWLKEKGVV